MKDEAALPKLRTFIKNYGLRWQRQFVNFKNPASILGYAQGDKKKQAVDFASQTGVYALYDGPELVYIGRAVNGERPLGSRLARHHVDPIKADRWTNFSWFGFRIVNKTLKLQPEALPKRLVSGEDVAELFEGLMIEFIAPRLNNRGGDLSRVAKFDQIKPEGSPAFLD